MTEGAAAFGDMNARGGETLLAPAARPGAAGAPLRDLLSALALPVDDARRVLGAATLTLADVLDRRIELIEIGYDGGLRAKAYPAGPSDPAGVDVAIVPDAGLAPADPDDATVDRVLGWMTVASDRHRLRDRLRELRIAPWADSTADGVALRMAAARAALARLIEATPEAAGEPAPDLIVAAGGVWSIVPPPAVALAIADVLRRPGASGYALDHARLLGPLGSIPDPDERRAVIADLADDLLAPLGSVVTPAGLKTGRSAGSLVVHDRPRVAGSPTPRSRSPIDLMPGGLAMVALPPGRVGDRGVPLQGQRPPRRPRPPLRGRRLGRAGRTARRPARRAAAPARSRRPASGASRFVAGHRRRGRARWVTAGTRARPSAILRVPLPRPGPRRISSSCRCDA